MSLQTDKVKKRGRKPKIKDTDNDNQDLDNVEIKIPKKRGRKPKVKEDTSDDKPIQKKRGRKPKIKVINEEPKIPKKRSRKPKEKIIQPQNINNNHIANDNIIIHLPINSRNIINTVNNDLLSYNPILNEPKPNEISYNSIKTDNLQFISQEKNTNSNNSLKGKGICPSTEYCQYPFDEKNSDIFEMLEDLNQSDDCEPEKKIENINSIETNHNIEHIDNWHKKNEEDISNKNNQDNVNSIMDNIINQRNIERSNYSSKTNKSNVEKCLIQLDESNKTSKWPSSTSLHCWWCCHPFEGPPCALPCDYNNETFKVLGIFCSPECAASYNFNDTNSGYDLWERYSLLNLLYRKVYNDNNIKVKLAPPRETLSIFGGHLSINNFRMNNTNYNNTYKLIIPPLISIIPIQELTEIDKGYSSNQDKKYIMIDKDKVKQDGDTLRLKRSKPFNSNKNTLEKCMFKSLDTESNISDINE